MKEIYSPLVSLKQQLIGWKNYVIQKYILVALIQGFQLLMLGTSNMSPWFHFLYYSCTGFSTTLMENDKFAKKLKC